MTEAHYQRPERADGSFQRVFEQPIPVDAEQVQSRFKDGILKPQLPKHEIAKLRRIAVQS